MVDFGILILSGSRRQASWDKKSVGELRMKSVSGLVETFSVDCHNTCLIAATGSSLFPGFSLHSTRMMRSVIQMISGQWCSSVLLRLGQPSRL